MNKADWQWLAGILGPVLLSLTLGFGRWLMKIQSDLSSLKQSVHEGFAAQQTVNQRVEDRQRKVDEALDEICRTLPVVASRVEDMWKSGAWRSSNKT